MEKVFEIYIKTTPERLWEAITDPEMRSKYTFGLAVESDWTPGSSYRGVSPMAPGPIIAGENWRSTRRAGSSRASTPCGATT